MEKKQEKTIVVKIDGGLGRNIAMTGAITELAKKRPVRVIASRPLAFWGNPFIESIHGLDDRDLFRQVIRGNDYFELEPYTDPKFFNDAENRLNVASRQLGLDKIADPVLFLAEHEKIQNTLCNGCRPILFQPFGSSVQDPIGADKSYRSLYVKDAQYIADGLIANGFTPYEVIRQGQPILNGCQVLDTPDMRFVLSLCERYPLIGIDSSLHHATKAFGKQSIVIRAGTDVERYGYKSHVNLREFPMVAHTPMRLPMNSFDFDISNQNTNKFSKEFLDGVIKTAVNLFQ